MSDMVALDPSLTYMVTIPQLAKMLGMPSPTVYQLAREGHLPFPVERFGRAMRCRMADVAAYLRNAAGEVLPVEDDNQV